MWQLNKFKLLVFVTELIIYTEEIKRLKIYLRERKRSQDVDKEFRPQVSLTDLVQIHNKFASTEHSRTRRNIGCSKFYEHIKKVEEISQGSEAGNEYPQIQVDTHARMVPILKDRREVEEQGIYKESNQTREGKYSIPFKDKVTPRIQYRVSMENPNPTNLGWNLVVWIISQNGNWFTTAEAGFNNVLIVWMEPAVESLYNQVVRKQ